MAAAPSGLPPSRVLPPPSLTATQEQGNPEPREVLKHVNALDGIRGLAILVVLLHHLLASNDQTGSAGMNLVVKVRESGWIGVDLFFALSGFLITGILFESLQKQHYFRNFYFRRVLRIAPLYCLVLIVLFLVHAGARSGQWTIGRLLLLLAYLQNTPLWWNHVAHSSLTDMTGHLWSLAVEEQFYMVWPLLIFAVRDRRRLLYLAVALIVLAPVSRLILLAHGAPFAETYKLTFCRMDSLLGGAWLALIGRGPARERVFKYAWPVFGVAVIGCLAIAWGTGNFDWEKNWAINAYGYTLLAVASTALIALSIYPSGFVGSLMSRPFLRFFGKYSYGIYVFHQMIGSEENEMLLQHLRDHLRSKAAVHLTIMFVTAAITIPLAVLSFAFYERPFLRMKRFFD